MYKNIEKEKVINLKDLVDYSEGQVVSKTLVQNELVSMTVFSFDKGEAFVRRRRDGDRARRKGKIYRRREGICFVRRGDPYYAEGNTARSVRA